MKTPLPILALIATIAATTEATVPAALINLKSQLGNYVLNAAGSAIQAKQNVVRSSTSALINAKTQFLQRQLSHFLQFNANQINSVLELKKNLLKSKAALIGQQIGGNVIPEQDVAQYSPPAAPSAPIGEPHAAYSPLTPQEPLSLAAPPVPTDDHHAAYSPLETFPPAAPPVLTEDHHTAYNPLETFPPAAPPVLTEEQAYSPPVPLEPLPPAAPPVEIPLGPYPPPSYLAKRQLMSRQELPVKDVPANSSFRPQRTPSHESKYNKIQYSEFPTPPPQPPARTVTYI